MKTALKRALLPTGLHVRTIPFGIARGVRMDIDFAQETHLYLGLYELELARHFRRICRPGVKTFDVGGQHGYDALAFARMTQAPVVCFECDHAAAQRMTHTFKLNAALTALIEPVAARVGTGRHGTVSIDDYSARTFMPDFVKIDVEGAELDVLVGAERVLAKRHPAVVVEVHSATLEQRCGQLLVEHGYRPLVVNQRRFLADHRPTDEMNRWLVAA